MKHKKHEHIRSEYEIKDKVKSIRMSNEQERKIHANADKAGMSVSNYMVTTSANGGTGLTPQLLVEIQNLVNYSSDCVAEKAPDMVVEMQRMVDSIWQKLL